MSQTPTLRALHATSFNMHFSSTRWEPLGPSHDRRHNPDLAESRPRLTAANGLLPTPRMALQAEGRYTEQAPTKHGWEQTRLQGPHPHQRSFAGVPHPPLSRGDTFLGNCKFLRTSSPKALAPWPSCREPLHISLSFLWFPVCSALVSELFRFVISGRGWTGVSGDRMLTRALGFSTMDSAHQGCRCCTGL